MHPLSGRPCSESLPPPDLVVATGSSGRKDGVPVRARDAASETRVCRGAIDNNADDGPHPMAYIKNLPHKDIFRLADQVAVQNGQVVSKTVAQNNAVSLTIFAFDKGEEISTHESKGDAMVTVLEGKGRFTVEEDVFILNEGESLIMPAGKPHSVHGEEAFKMLLTVVFPRERNVTGIE
jgi:quercetin dioxygenase-like cupin family protein